MILDKGTTIEDFLKTELGQTVAKIFSEHPDPPSIGAKDWKKGVTIDLGTFGKAKFTHKWDEDDPDRQIRVLYLHDIKDYKGDEVGIEDCHGYGDLTFVGNNMEIF